MTMTRTGMRQGSPEWLEARRSLITGSDMPVLLGLSPWKVEADVAAEKTGEWRQPATLRMRVGTAVEPLIADAYTEQTGRRLQRIRDLVVHSQLAWAAASPDRRVVGERRMVELKWTGGRGRFADGLPADVEAQVRWTLGVMEWPVADVAALVGGGDELRVYEVEHDPDLFEAMVEVAADFRRRLAAGGPFAQSSDSLRRRWPFDTGAEMVADADMEEAVRTLLALRAQRRDREEQEEALENAIKARMADAAVLTGDGWKVHWKRSKDSTLVDWQSIAQGLLPLAPEDQRDALVSIHTTVRQGMRPFRVVKESRND
jgi:putative phage-type endonuclease